MTQELIEKCSRAEALICEAERKLKEVKLDFGMQFAQNRCQGVETSLQQLREYLAEDDEQGIDQLYANLQDAISELTRQVRDYYGEYPFESSGNADDNDDFWNDEDDNTGGSPPIPVPRRPNPTPGTNDSAEFPPIDYPLV